MLRCLVLVVSLLVVVAAAEAETTVCLQPLEPYDASLVAPAARGIEHLYALPVRVLPARPIPPAAWYQPRRRYRADRVLDFLLADVVPSSGCDQVVGFTSRDISVAKGTNQDWGIFGLAYLDNRVTVISSYRLTRGGSRKKLIQRVVKVVNHELGHAFGLEHREGKPRPDCIMNDAGGTIRTVDAELGLLCDDEVAHLERVLKKSLPKLTSLDWTYIVRGP